MQRWTTFFNNQNMLKRLAIWFLLIALIPLGWTVLISYEVSKSTIYKLVENQLKTVIYRQGQLLQYYFEEKENNTVALAEEIKAPGPLATVKLALKTDPEGRVSYEHAEKTLRPMITGMLKGLRFRNLFIIAPDTTIAFSVYPSTFIGSPLSDIKSYVPLNPSFKNAELTKEPQLASIAAPFPKVALMTYVFVPLLEGSETLGYLLVELDTSNFYNLLTEYNSLAQTGGLGELLMVGIANNQFFSITTEPNQGANYTSATIDPSSTYGAFVQHILKHQHIVTNVVTRDNQELLIAGKRILPDFNWAIVIEMRLAELYAPIYKIEKLFWILAATTAIAVTLAAAYVARKIASPILTLTRKTQLLARGDLSQRIDVVGKDEIGRLGESFNNMAAQLDQMVSHLDALVAQRTKEYEVQNIELEKTIKELKSTQDRLIIQEKLASLGALTAGIAHEIKNPLNFINNFAELCSQAEEDLKERFDKIKSLVSTEDADEITSLLGTLRLDLSKIYEHGKRADSIVRNMLQHSRAVPGQKETIDIHPLLEEYISLSYHGMRAQDSTFNVKIEKYFDPSIQPIPVVPQEISRVFLNLLNNAYYAVAQKSKMHLPDYTPIVRITTENHGNYITIKFWDNGTGIPPEVLPKLFTPFFTTKPSGEGTGLGLSLSYNLIVQGHQGSLTAQSTPDTYAKFTITLPTGLNDHD